ncbi:hypothetical protein [uncultured Flavonifractor sp.]|uniref:hypothetical protein n=1 Tax=uncultured Flavonifractor sp. TaxID=1193534 RepID=UPI0026057941|nr:hypothetical protein [uncultured Flavonifractor sp.]
MLKKQCGQHFVRRSDAADEQAGNNTENSAKASILGAPKCDQNVRKRYGKKAKAIIYIPKIQEKQRKQIGTHNQHRCDDPAGPPLGHRFPEVDQKDHKAAQKGLRDPNINGVIKIQVQHHPSFRQPVVAPGFLELHRRRPGQ